MIISTTPNSHGRLLCNIENEGGRQEGIDIGPIMREEFYLKTHSEERIPRAFLEFCREGGVEAIVDLLHAEHGSLHERYSTSSAILRYQDSQDSMKSALHHSVAEGNYEVTWLLLLLASSLDLQQFPLEVKDVANQMNLVRESQEGLEDIRNLKDQDGMTAGQRALVNPESTFNSSLLIA